jgi:hypothetical protein
MLEKRRRRGNESIFPSRRKKIVTSEFTLPFPQNEVVSQQLGTVRSTLLSFMKKVFLTTLPALIAIVLCLVALSGCSKPRRVSASSSCLNNLRQIDGAKQQWALENKKQASDIPTEKDLMLYLGRSAPDATFPACPQGGRYTINSVEKAPTCSFHGDILK